MYIIAKTSLFLKIIVALATQTFITAQEAQNNISRNNIIFINTKIAVNNDNGAAKSKCTDSLTDQNKSDVKRKAEEKITYLFKHI